MSFVPLTSEELEAGKPVTSELLNRIRTNLDDLDGRAEGTETVIVDGNNTILERNSTLVQFGDTTSGGFTTTLPPAGDMLHKTLIFKKISNDSNVWTIDADGTETIESQSTQTLSTQNQVIYIVSDGSAWWKISDIDASGQVPQSRTINTTAPLSGGGNLTTDRTLVLALANGSIYIGNGSNIPEAQVVSGDVTIGVTGVTAISSGVIVNADINASAAIDSTKIAITASLVSDTNNTDDLGTDAVEWKDLWTHSIKHNDASNPHLALSTTGNNGNITITPHGSGEVTIASNVTAPSIKLTTGAGAGKLLQSDASGNATWESVSGTTLAGLTDVDLSSPAQYEVLQYDGSDWVNAVVGTNNIDNLAVTAGKIANTTITDGKIANATITLAKMAVTTANRILVTDSGGAPSVAGALSASRALVTNSSGMPAVSTVTSTEVGYLSGVTSAIQTQINTKATTLSNLASTYTDATDRPGGASGVNVSGLSVSGSVGATFLIYITVVSTSTSLGDRASTHRLEINQDAAGDWNIDDTTLTGSEHTFSYTITSGGQIQYSHSAFTNHTANAFRWRGYQIL